jgi:hypothetical protein
MAHARPGQTSNWSLRARGRAWFTAGLLLVATASILLTAAPNSYGSATAPPSAGAPASPVSVGSPSSNSVPGGHGVTAAATALTFTESVSTGPVGTSVLFSASGFAKSSAFSITWTPTSAAGTTVTVCSNRTTSTGTDSCGYKIPPTAAGAYTFTAKDGSGHTASVIFHVTPTLVAAPTSGPVGSIVIVTGSAFASGTNTRPVSVTVVWNSVVVCPSSSTSTNLYGNFTCAFALPAAPAGAHLFTATDALGNSQTASFTVVSRLVVSPSYVPGGMGYGPSGSTVRFTGTGFAASHAVSVIWTVGTACGPTSSPNGGFNCSYTIPAEAPGGDYSFQASDGTNHASVPFAVTFLQSTATAAPFNTTLTITSGGFTPNASVTLSWVDGTLFTGVTNASGSFPAYSFIVPYLAAGSYPFHAQDAFGLAAGFTLTVVPALTVRPIGGPVSTPTTWYGTGFAPASAVSLAWTGGTVCTSTTNASGSFTCPFTVPPTTAGGVYAFTAQDAASHTASATFTVTFLSALPPSGPVGTPVNLSGGGFTPGASFNVTLGSTIVCTGTASAIGAFVCKPFAEPASPAGRLTFNVLDGSGRNASAQFTVVPSLAVKPSVGAVGTRVNFTGAGFAAAVNVTVGWSGGTACSNVTAATGGFVCSFVLPPESVGPYQFTAIDSALNLGRATFTVVPHLTAQPKSGPVATTVLLSATGFAGRSPITISSSLAVACSGTTDPLGSFSCSYAIPTTVKATINFTAIDQSSDTAFVHFAVAAELSATPSSGLVGTIVTFAGTGFAAGSLATVSWSAGPVCSNTTSAFGSFACAFVIPASSAGAHTFTGKDSATVPDSASATFTVLPAVQLNRTLGSVGAPLSVSGSGFAPNATVTVSVPSGTLCTATSGTFGGFACATTIPAAVVGNLTVTADDGSGHRAFASVTVVPRLVALPSSGPVGSNVTLQGTGFAGASAVSVGWTHGTVCTATTGSNGTFDCSVIMPPATAGPHAFNGTDAQGDSASAVFSVVSSFSAGLTASPFGGPPGTVVTLQGTGFAAAVTVNVTWTFGLACSNTSDGSGSFSCRFSIPLATPGGAYSFSGSDGRGDSASASFIVTFLAAQPAQGVVGDVVTFTGGGFALSNTYTVSWTSGTVCSGATSPTGGLSCTFTVPAVASGTYSFRATDGLGTSASATFVVLPVLTASPAQGPTGTPVTFTGSAFAPLASYTVSWSGGTACVGTTSGTGGFSCSYTIPAAPSGRHLFTASDGANSSSASFVVLAALSNAPVSGPVGSTVTFTGTGYAADLPVSVNGSGGASCGATTDANGGFACALSVGARPEGAYTFVGAQGGGLPSASSVFSVAPNLTVVPVYGPSGTTLSFTSTGFGGSVAMSVLWSGGTACTGSTNAVGSFFCTFFVPPSLSGGVATFTAVDGLSNSATATYLVVPDVVASPGFGIPGTTVTFTGLGFKATSSVTVTWAGGTACSTTTNASGQFTCPFTIPLGTVGGSYTFAATDTAGGRASTTFTVSYLTVAPASATVGTLLTFNGGGFAPDSSYAIGWFGGSACAGTTSAQGTFRCTFSLGTATEGPHMFSASDGVGESASVAVTVVPALAVAPASGPSGSAIVLSGTGFSGNLSLGVTWSAGHVCNATTNAVGDFACPFTLPVVPVGIYTFTATDSAGHSANGTFDVVLPTTFALTFTESGLPAGTNWTVVVNGVAETGNTSSLVFNEPNGAYSYTVRSTGYVASPASGSVSVSGATVGVSTSFAPMLYAVAFDETGLFGQSWSVTIGASTVTSTAPTIVFDLANGSYSYSVAAFAGYLVAPRSGTVDVAGASPTAVQVGFSLVTYGVTFNETGLPSGHSWSVVLNGVATAETSASATVQRPNGTYTFDFQSAGYVANPTGGTLVVDGASPSTVVVSFTRLGGYPLTFLESGLPAATTWTVVVNSVTYHVSGTTLTLNETNATYTWRVSAPGFKTTTPSGSVTINGGPMTVTVAFSVFTYTVTFNASGLPAGDAWQVTVVGMTPFNSTNHSIAVQLGNGSYYALFDAPAGYVAKPTSAYANVSGRATLVQVALVSASSLQPPPATFLGFSDNTGYYILIGVVAGGIAVAAVVGYLMGRRKVQKTIASDFL